MAKYKPTKAPSVARMARMAKQLRGKYRCYCMVQIECNAFWQIRDERTRFTIYIDGIVGDKHFYLDTWPELEAKFKELMTAEL